MATDNLLTGKALDAAYDKYIASYRNKQRELRNKFGLSMWDQRYTKIEFQNMYAAQANDLMRDNNWKSAKDVVVIRKLIERQATELTEDQAKAFQKGMAKQGKFMTLGEIYKFGPEQIRELDEKLITEGVGGSERRRIISAAFFGSP